MPDAAVLDHVEAAPAVAADGVAGGGDQLVQRHRGAVERDGDAPLEPDDELRRLGRGARGAARHAVDLLGRLDPGVLEDPALDGAAPEVLVDRVRAVLAHRDGDVVRGGVVDRVLAGEAPRPHGREHVEVGRERPHRHLEAHLVVALAGAAVGDGVGAVLPGGAHEVAHDHRPRQRRHERVLALVERVRRAAPAARSRRRTRRARRRRSPRPRRRRARARGWCPSRRRCSARRRRRAPRPRRPIPR